MYFAAEQLVRFCLAVIDDAADRKDLEKTLAELENAEFAPKAISRCITLYELTAKGMYDVLHEHFSVSADAESIRLRKQEFFSFAADPDNVIAELKEICRGMREKIPCRKLYISDLHFYHNSLNRQMDFRGFDNHHDMDEHMIARWNSKVTAKDEVYILGDLSVGGGKATNEIVRRLNGRLYLIRGNHDKFTDDRDFDRERFVWIRDYAEIRDNGRKVILSHYPVFCYNGQYRKNEDGPLTWMLYGHVHNTFDEVLVNQFIRTTRNAKRMSKYSSEPEPVPCQMINCFCMFSDYQPLSLDEWIAVDELRRGRWNNDQENDELP
jgi:calcineurin-like phosphoesterase family protein